MVDFMYKSSLWWFRLCGSTRPNDSTGYKVNTYSKGFCNLQKFQKASMHKGKFYIDLSNL